MRFLHWLRLTEPERPFCASCGWWHAGGCG